MKNLFLVAIVVAAIVGFVSWQSDRIESFIFQLDRVSIEEMEATPKDFHGSIVTLTGQVREVYNVPSVSRHLYALDDGSGKIWVLGSGRVPRVGKELNLRGMVAAGKEQFGGVHIERVMIIEIRADWNY